MATVINLSTGKEIKLESVKRYLRRRGVPNTIQSYKNLFEPAYSNEVITYDPMVGGIRVIKESTLKSKLKNMSYNNIKNFIENYVIFSEPKIYNPQNKLFVKDTRQNRNRINNYVSSINQITFEQLVDRVNNSQFYGVDTSKPFQITLAPLLIDINNELLTFTFKNLNHFMTWYEKVKATGVSDSSNETAVNISGRNIDDLFEFSMTQVEGGCSKHGAKYENVIKNIIINNTKYEIHINNVLAKNNLCAFKAIEILLKTKINVDECRNEFTIKVKQLVDVETLVKIYNKYNKSSKQLIVVDTIDRAYNFETSDYIWFKDNHYKVITSCNLIEEDVRKIRRRLATWDTETRRDKTSLIKIGQYNKETQKVEKVWIEKLKATILHFYSDGIEHHFESDDEKNCVVKFRDFLKQEAHENRYYSLFAHNGAKFDNFLFLSELSGDDLYGSNMIPQGTSILQFEYLHHIFRDSCKHLPFSLDTLCKAYKVDVSKQCMIRYNNKDYTNTEFCFYMKDLDYKEFLQLKIKEPEYWRLYNEYCLYDCISLYKLLDIYNKQSKLIIEKICYDKTWNMLGKLTVSAGAFTMLEKSCEHNITKSMKQFINDEEKELFTRSLVRGGISHVNKYGKFNCPIVGYDITSQYPYSMMNCDIPIGESRWVDTYDENHYGYYHLINLKFNSDVKFKPIPNGYDSNGSLEWLSGKEIKEAKIDTMMIQYLQSRFGLYDFQVVKGLVSTNHIKGSQIYSNFVNGLFEEKKKQDELKDKKDPEYNNAYREIVKLCLNGVTGKTVENKRARKKFEFSEKSIKDTVNGMNGGALLKTETSEINQYITTGLGIYTTSKILLFEYLFCLGNPDDVIAIETDGIYFQKKYEETFIKNVNEYQENGATNLDIKFGSELGNIKREKESVGASYFLGKKFYHYNDGKKNTFKIKGIPLETIDEDGSKVKLVSTELYENIYNGRTQSFTFPTIKKILFGSTSLSHYMMTREIKPMGEYQEYY